MGWAGVAASAVSAISSINQGNAQNQEAKINAALTEGKAQLIDVQKGIENQQYNRAAGRMLSTSMASAAASGVMPSGSPMAVMLDAQTQIKIDQAISQFNFDQQKRYTLAEADTLRRQGKQAVQTGYSNAFVSALSGASKAYQYYGGTTSAGTVKDTTFDSVSLSNKLVYGRR